MTRRKITINGNEHKYSIGRTHVKIDGIGAFEKERIGTEIPVRDLDGTIYAYRVQVTPDQIRTFASSYITAPKS